MQQYLGNPLSRTPCSLCPVVSTSFKLRQDCFRAPSPRTATRSVTTMAVDVPYAKLNNGHSIPTFGLGLFGLSNGDSEKAVQTAFDLGYRHFDSARMYKNEVETGKGFAALISSGKAKREDLYIVSKLPPSAEALSSTGVEKTIRDSINELQCDYLDLIHIHWPVSDKPGKHLQPDPPIQETWKALEECVDKGLVRSIGIANFSPHKLDQWFSDVRIYPQVLQSESHPYYRNDASLEWCKQHGVHFTAYSPFGSPGTMQSMGAPVPTELENDTVKSIAQKHGKTPAQVLVAWALARGASTIPKSGSPDRQKDNIGGVNFQLPSEDVAALSKLPQTKYFKGDGLGFGENKPYNSYEELWDEPLRNDFDK